MITFPHAKINLGLHVLEEREDGFHNIETVYYPVGWYDSVEVIEESPFGFQVFNAHRDEQQANQLEDSNLCIKAYNLLREHYEVPSVQIALLKNIPVRAGLGGGSADGAFTLQLLNRMFDLGIAGQELRELAVELGSDCPFFLWEGPALATGRGEQLSPIDLDLSGYQLFIITPDIEISTQWAYEQVEPREPTQPLVNIVQQPVTAWQEFLDNQFETVILKEFPQIQRYKAQLYDSGAVYASLSGSGSALFGIFPENANLDVIKDRFELPESHIWTVGKSF